MVTGSLVASSGSREEELSTFHSETGPEDLLPNEEDIFGDLVL